MLDANLEYDAADPLVGPRKRCRSHDCRVKKPGTTGYCGYCAAVWRAMSFRQELISDREERPAGHEERIAAHAARIQAELRRLSGAA